VPTDWEDPPVDDGPSFPIPESPRPPGVMLLWTMNRGDERDRRPNADHSWMTETGQVTDQQSIDVGCGLRGVRCLSYVCVCAEQDGMLDDLGKGVERLMQQGKTIHEETNLHVVSGGGLGVAS
jgi:hypothetical protein